jgi:hypothetical protein
MKIRVMLMRRDGIGPDEAQSLASFYPEGTEFEIVRRDPVNYLEHLTMCEEFEPDVVILPREKPVPILAMDKGYAHISMTPLGFRRLLRVPPDFVPFVPGLPLPKIATDQERLEALGMAIADVGALSARFRNSERTAATAILNEMYDEIQRRLELQAPAKQ